MEIKDEIQIIEELYQAMWDEALESMFNSNLSSGKSVTLEFPNGTPTIERKET